MKILLKDNKILYEENDMLKRELDDMKDYFETELRKREMKLMELSNELEKTENINNQMKLRMKEMFSDMKNRDEKISFTLKEEGKELENRLITELNDMRRKI